VSGDPREEVAATGVRLVTVAPDAAEAEPSAHTGDELIGSGCETWQKAVDGALAPQAVVEAIGYAYRQPANVTIREVVLTATGQDA